MPRRPSAGRATARGARPARPRAGAISAISASSRSGRSPIGRSRVGGDGVEDPDEPVGERRGPCRRRTGRSRSRSRRDMPAGAPSVVELLGQDQFEVHLDHVEVEVDALDLAGPAVSRCGRLVVLELERHLEQRRVRRRPGRVRAPRRPARTARRRARTPPRSTSRTVRSRSVNDRGGVDLGAQDQGVDEHADQVVEGGARRGRRSGCRSATSSVPPSRPSSTASAACTAMNIGGVVGPAPVRERAVQVGVDRRSRPDRPRKDCCDGRGRSVGQCAGRRAAPASVSVQ